MSKAELVNKMVKSVRGVSAKEIVIDSHCHIFNYDCMADELRDRYTMNLAPKHYEGFLSVVNNPFDDNDFFDRARKFFDICGKDNTKIVADTLLDESKFDDTNKKLIFTPLMMDTEYAVRNHSDKTLRPKKDFFKQKEEMTEVVLKYPGVFLPFIAADPRRIKANKKKQIANDPDGIKYIKDALARQGFWGVKIYPPLGYVPDNPALRPLYKYCEVNEIPITAHCLHGGTYSAQDVQGDKNTMPKKRVYYWRMANPVNWEPVIVRYPQLKINLGHFGGDIYAKGFIFKDNEQIEIEREWRETIVSYLKKYPNVYADFSYIEAMFNEPYKYFQQLKKYLKVDEIRRKILYGTDWWVNRTLCSESEHLLKFLELSSKYDIKDAHQSCLLKDNAVEFLGLDNPESGPLSNYINFLAGKGKKLPSWFKFMHRDFNVDIASTPVSMTPF